MAVSAILSLERNMRVAKHQNLSLEPLVLWLV
jgi:hypothetical protein